jgi:hypothetical protein
LDVTVATAACTLKQQQRSNVRKINTRIEQCRFIINYWQAVLVC